MSGSDVFVLAAQTTFVAGLLTGLEIAGVAREMMVDGQPITSDRVRRACRQAAEDYATLLRDSVGEDSPVMTDLAQMRAHEIVERAKDFLREDDGDTDA